MTEPDPTPAPVVPDMNPTPTPVVPYVKRTPTEVPEVDRTPLIPGFGVEQGYTDDSNDPAFVPYTLRGHEAEHGYTVPSPPVPTQP